MNDESNKDPILMYLIVKESLNMSPGKMAAQIGHSVQLLNDIFYDKKESHPLDRDIQTYWDWRITGFAKVILSANDKEWDKVKSDLAIEQSIKTVVVDEGRTEIPSGSETVIGLWPRLKTSIPKSVKRLQLLK